jgi:hypothetical protein
MASESTLLSSVRTASVMLLMGISTEPIARFIPKAHATHARSKAIRKPFDFFPRDNDCLLVLIELFKRLNQRQHYRYSYLYATIRRKSLITAPRK